MNITKEVDDNLAQTTGATVIEKRSNLVWSPEPNWESKELLCILITLPIALYISAFTGTHILPLVGATLMILYSYYIGNRLGMIECALWFLTIICYTYIVHPVIMGWM
jgi:hypothetical protein